MNLILLTIIQIVFNVLFSQAANWDFQFAFNGYMRQNDDFLLKNCPKNANDSFVEAEQMINRVFQGKALEMPTTNLNLPHVTCANDTRMGPTVKFIIYKDDDDFTGQVDKQRMEMKTNEGAKSLTAKEGDSFVYAWWFQIDPQIILHPQNQFLHVFQIKGVGANISSDPLVTFTLTNSRLFHMRLHYGNSSFDAKTLMDLSEAKGRWIQVFVEAVFRKTGSIRVIMKDEKGNVLVPEQMYPFPMWWDGTQFFRTKWGLYRKMSPEYQPSDWQLFQNIQIWRKEESGPPPTPSDSQNLDLLGISRLCVWVCACLHLYRF